jgi:hypothetical protein
MKTKLNFRLTTPKHGSLTVSTTDDKLNAYFLHETTKLVQEAFIHMHGPGIKMDGKTPEVISDTTLAQIEALEGALEFCRNMMIDVDIEDAENAAEWTRAIDQAADALGYEDYREGGQ